MLMEPVPLGTRILVDPMDFVMGIEAALRGALDLIGLGERLLWGIVDSSEPATVGPAGHHRTIFGYLLHLDGTDSGSEPLQQLIPYFQRNFELGFGNSGSSSDCFSFYCCPHDILMH